MRFDWELQPYLSILVAQHKDTYVWSNGRFTGSICVHFDFFGLIRIMPNICRHRIHTLKVWHPRLLQTL